LLPALEFDEQQTSTNSSFDAGCRVPLSPQTYECPNGQKKWHSRKQALVGTLQESGYIGPKLGAYFEIPRKFGLALTSERGSLLDVDKLLQEAAFGC
jgi:hypothetical protein